jgi:hypothetical protein
MRLDRDSGLLADELALLWHYLLLDYGLLSMGLCSLPLLTSVSLLKGEADIQLQLHHLRWNHRYGLSGRSVLHPWCGCDGSGRSPHVAPPVGREVRAPSPLGTVRNSSVESSIMAHREDGVLLRVGPMKAGPELPLLGERLKPLK